MGAEQVLPRVLGDHSRIRPDFGVDGDVKTTLNNAGTAEKQYGHFWDATKAAPADHPKDYFVPNFG